MHDVASKKTEFAILVVVIPFFNDFRRLWAILNFRLNYSNIFISIGLDQRREF